MNSVNNVNIFEVKNLDYDYPGNIAALKQVSFTVKPGEVVALVGANGSGKSTLLKLLDGLIFPKAGELIAFGKPLSEEGLKDKAFIQEFRRKVGMVFQDPDVQLFSPTVWDEVTFGPLQLGISKDEVIARGQAALDLMGIAHSPAAASLSAFRRGEKEGLAGLGAFTAAAGAAAGRTDDRPGPIQSGAPD